jgi:hypothetical protein
MKKNTTKLTTKQAKNLLLVLLLFLGNRMLYAQSCTVNAGGNATICGTSYTLQGSASGTTVGNPTWTLVSKPAGAPDPVISNINSYTPNVTGMTFPGNYVFQIAQNCSSGSGTSQVTITAPGDTTGFTAGPDITNVNATVGTVTLNGVVPAGYTASWSAYNLWNYQRFNTKTSQNSQFSSTTSASTTFSLVKKANHDIDPSYVVTLRITSVNNPDCWYEDTAIIRFIPNPQIIVPNSSGCFGTGSTYIYLSNTSPIFSTVQPGAAGNPSYGTTVTMNVNSQPAGGNIQYTRIEDGILFFTGASTPGTYKFTLTVTNSSGTYTTPEITFTNSGSAPGLGTFIVASDPEQMEYYSYVGSGGEVQCGMAGSTTPITFRYTLNAADDPTTIASTVSSSGIAPPGGAPGIATAGTGATRSVTVTPPAGGWSVGTYKFNVRLSNGSCTTTMYYFLHISDGARPNVAVPNTTICYPGSGVVAATIPLPAVYKQVINSSYFQEYNARYNFSVVSKPAGSGTPSYGTPGFTETSTVIGNLTMPGEYVFKIKANSGAAGDFIGKEYECAGTSREGTFSIFVSPQINANAGSDQSITCSTSATLNGNDPGTQGSTGQWTLTSKPSGAPDPVITAPTQYNSGVTNLTYTGTYTFTWTITTGTCVSSDQVDINVTAAPSSVTATPATQTVAYNAVPTNLTATATGATTYQWYSNTANNNTGGTLIPGATSANYTPPTNISGTTYYYVVAGNGSCSTPSAAVQVIVTPCAAVPNAPNVNSAVSNNCPASAVNLNTQAFTGAVPANAALQWFTDAAHNNAVATPTAVEQELIMHFITVLPAVVTHQPPML